MFRRTPILRMQPTRSLLMRNTLRRRGPIPKEDQSAHTVSQRLRTLKQIPTEIYPLLFVLGVAVGAAVFSLGRKLYTDKSLRLKRQGKE